jgi:hypothetical protein
MTETVNLENAQTDLLLIATGKRPHTGGRAAFAAEAGGGNVALAGAASRLPAVQPINIPPGVSAGMIGNYIPDPSGPGGIGVAGIVNQNIPQLPVDLDVGSMGVAITPPGSTRGRMGSISIASRFQQSVTQTANVPDATIGAFARATLEPGGVGRTFGGVMLAGNTAVTVTANDAAIGAYGGALSDSQRTIGGFFHAGPPIALTVTTFPMTGVMGTVGRREGAAGMFVNEPGGTGLVGVGKHVFVWDSAHDLPQAEATLLVHGPSTPPVALTVTANIMSIAGQAETVPGFFWNMAGGPALDIQGDSFFSGEVHISHLHRGTIPAHVRQFFVSDATVDDDCLPMAMLRSNPGKAVLQWIEKQPGVGLVFHFNAPLANATGYDLAVLKKA